MATLFKSVLEKYKNDIFVETGTLWGESVELALDCGFKKIYSIELNPEKVLFNKEKFKKEIEEGIVNIIEGDTFEVFPEILKEIKSQATFWLDAHWDDGPIGAYKCPLPFELKALENHTIKTHTILIDDRRIFGQSGTNWGEEIDEKNIIDSLLKINSYYDISYEDGCVPNDIIVAKYNNFEEKKKIHSIDYSKLKGVIHIGASIGQDTHHSGIRFYDSHNLNVLWIEAIPSIFNILKNNIKDYPKQKAIQCLLTDKDNEEYDFYISNNNGESSSIFDLHMHKEIWSDVHYVEKLKLKSKTLSTLIKENNIDINDYNCITLDTQGSELLVLKGSLELLDKIEFINTEVANFESYKDCCTLDDMDLFFKENNYTRINLRPWSINNEYDYFDAIYRKNNSKKDFQIFCDGGFANRFSTLIGGLTLARTYGYNPVINWPSTNECRAKFYDIFSKKIKLNVNEVSYKNLNLSDNDYVMICSIQTFENYFKHINFNSSIILDDVKNDCTSAFSPDEFSRIIEFHKNKNIFYSNTHLSNVPAKIEDIYITVSSLDFNEEIINDLNKFINENNLVNKYNGVHIRNTDFNETFDINDLFNFIKDYSKNFLLNKFFICSDDPEIELKFGELPNTFSYPKKHRTEKYLKNNDWKHSYVNEDGIEVSYNVERSVEHVKESIIDFILLSFSNQFRPTRYLYSRFFNLAEEISKPLKEKYLDFNNDILFKNKHDKKIAIFYHLGQFNDWKNLFHEQINALILSGLYDASEFIHIGINGNQELPFTLPKFVIKYNNNQDIEADTLKSLYDFSIKNIDYKILYFHTKGSSQEYNINITKWRHYLEYFNIHKWEDCIHALEKTDTAGVDDTFFSGLINQDTGIVDWEENFHYSGNFWWATAKYISKLNPDYLYNNDKGWIRYRSEFWIGTGHPSKTSFYNTNIFDKYTGWENLTSLDYVIKKESDSNNDKIAIFYHLYQSNNWKKLYHEQINSLIISELYDKCEFIHIGINGNQELPFVLDKMKVHYNENQILEANTLHSLWDYCNKNPDSKVLYFHSKGVTHYDSNLDTSTNAWRIYLEYFVIHKWKQCLNDLNSYDCVGSEWVNDSELFDLEAQQPCRGHDPHYAGNFWWANSSYVNQLDIDYIYNEERGWGRFKSEFWIGTKNPKYKSYHNSNKLLYDFCYTPNFYITDNKNMSNKKTKIVMISMFKNESKTIGRMLESCYKYIDYWILQDNGSTDGTPEVVREFFKDKNLPGFIYEVEEGWVGFGWNRNHLLQKCLETDHGCDWILKMDCDEYLEVDDDFDWSLLDDTSIQSFHITAQSPGCIYYRAWMWNATLPWHFKEDVAHECIVCDVPGVGENFHRFDLPRSFRQIGTYDGESYTVPTKYLSDALKLEEQLIREGTMLQDTYHFWYVAKSYQDCYAADFYPLGEAHSKEFARRFIFYFEEFLKYTNPPGINEMAYFSAFSIGLGYKFLGEIDKAIEWLNAAEKYCPVRNEHIVQLAQIYSERGQYERMLEESVRLINPNRKLPFPNFYFLIDSNAYYDSGPIPKQLYEYAVSKTKEDKTINSFSVNIKTNPRMWIVDNFYEDPHSVREFALKQEFEEDLNYYKGNRTKNQFIVPGTKEAFEKIIGKKITHWTETHGMCGRFQYCTAQDDLVYHCDSQSLAGMIYLTPDAPYSCGTSLFAHKETGLRNENDFGNRNVFSETGFYDRTKFELVDTAGNVFNRLVLFDAKCIHSANEYFGITKDNCRLFHLFFFD